MFSEAGAVPLAGTLGLVAVGQNHVLLIRQSCNADDSCRGHQYPVSVNPVRNLPLFSLMYVLKTKFHWRRLALQATARAWSLTLANAGMRMDTNNAMMAITTSSSISVNARRLTL